MADLIDRDMAIDAINEYMKRLRIHIATPNDTESYSYARGLLVGVINDIKQLPPIQPKRGRWVGKYPVTSVCSECGYLINDSKVKVFAFCPNCGARMEGTDGSN